LRLSASRAANEDDICYFTFADGANLSLLAKPDGQQSPPLAPADSDGTPNPAMVLSTTKHGTDREPYDLPSKIYNIFSCYLFRPK
jgi:hypothetical protein